MFDSLSRRLNDALRRLTGRGRISEANVREALQEVRRALLEADVNYKVAKDFTDQVLQEALGQEVLRSISPDQQLVKIVHDALVKLLGPDDAPLDLGAGRLPVIMLCGLQGSGKTTTAAKLGRLLAAKGRRPLLAACDLQRPAAVEQLRSLGAQLELPVYTEERSTPLKVAANALAAAARDGRDTVLLDTAGRLHIDQPLMAELQALTKQTQPREILLVADAMTGQDAVRSAAEFAKTLPLTGVILTKLDGDARGGAALSLRAVTGKPIKFVGLGEGLDRLEEFHPDRLAGRILGMGDVVTLVEKAQAAIEEEERQEMEERFLRGRISFTDFLKNLERLQRLGSMGEMLKLLPGGAALAGQVDEKELGRTRAIIQSMTPRERDYPEILDRSRRLRVARGSGTALPDVNRLVKGFRQLQKQFKQPTGLFGRLRQALRGGRGGAQAVAEAAAPAPGRPAGTRRLKESRAEIRQRRKDERRRRKQGRK